MASHDYSLTFKDCQKLQLLQQNLLRTSRVLGSSLNTVKGCEKYLRKLVALDPTSLGEQCLAEILMYADQIESHCRSITQIIQQSHGTRNLVCMISSDIILVKFL